MIEFRQVHKHFGALHVLDDISLRVAAGEVVVICGPSGSGKSTLLRCINRLEQIDSGEIVVDGISVAGTRDIARLRAEVGMVFQRFNLYPHLSVLDNLTLAPTKVRGLPKAKAVAAAMELLGRVGIPEKAAAWPAQLSGGQQQRVAIARSLVNNPYFMLTDEATGNLDSVTSEEILAMFERLNDEGRTIIMVTHEDDVAAHAKRIVRLKDGMIQSDKLNEHRVSALARTKVHGAELQAAEEAAAAMGVAEVA